MTVQYYISTRIKLSERLKRGEFDPCGNVILNGHILTRGMVIEIIDIF